MSELHKPATLGPWEWLEVSDRVQDYALIRSVFGRYVAEVRAGSGEADAAAIADLWWWIGRAERYERALRLIAGPSQYDRSALIGVAVDTLRDEGRLGEEET